MSNLEEAAMFYEVRVFNADGRIKKVITTNELRRTHWDNFRKAEESMSLPNSERVRVPQWIKDTLDLEFVGVNDHNFFEKD